MYTVEAEFKQWKCGKQSIKEVKHCAGSRANTMSTNGLTDNLIRCVIKNDGRINKLFCTPQQRKE